VHILNPQWRQAAGKIGAGMVIEFCSPLAGWGLGRFPAPRAFIGTDPARPLASSCQLRFAGLPGPQVRGTGGTLIVVWKGHQDRGHPPVTSHSSQGQTADRVLIHADAELGAKDLLNNRMAYVAVSRGADDAQIFTNDREKLGATLGHDISHGSAHAPEMKPEQKQKQAVTPQREIAQKQERSLDIGLSL